MTGPKAYTMREMKGIVEYLVENKAYSEIRGRKMWMDYANSSRTTRSWQSLKETFLKRILTDIQNPYYHLTRDQVCSFRQGVDVEAKERNNRLEILTVSEESTNNEKQNDIEQPCTSAEKPNEAEKPLGEKIKSAAITVRNRSSADTFIIDEDTESRNSRDYPQVSKKTTEELLEDLGEPTKSLKECLAFEHSEPPCVVRAVINDFETESEDSDKEPQMEIVEDTSVNEIADVNVVMDSETIDSVEFPDEERILVEGGMEVDIGPTFDHEIITEVTSTVLQGLNNWLEDCAHTEQEVPSENKSANSAVQQTTAKQNDEASRNGSREETEPIIIETVPIIVDDSENGNEKPKEQKKLDNENNNLSNLNATSDTIIPNNQEVLDATKSQRTSAKFDILAPLKDASRKRSTCPDQIVSKKTKLDNGLEPKTNGDVIEVTPPSSNDTEAIFEALKKSDKPVEDSTMQDVQYIDESPQNKNPCLKSVSLFEEQFNTTKYSDTDEDTPIPNNKEKITQNTEAAEDNQSKIVKHLPANDKKEKLTDPVKEKQIETVKTDPPVEEKQKETLETDPVEEKQKGTLETDPIGEHQQNETDLPDQVKQKKSEKKQSDSTKIDSPVQKKNEIIVLLNSESDAQQTTTPTEKRNESFQNLAHAFGFVPGTSRTAAHRRRSLRSRNRTKSQRSCNMNEDSDWESSISEPELAGENASQPRGQRNKRTRRYKKPSSSRIMSLNEEGGLFVIHGSRIFPLVKRGKVLNYVTLNSLGESEEEEESVWMQKFIEEKKKGAILKRKLEEIEACHCRSKSPILNPRNNQRSSADKQTEVNKNKRWNPEPVGDTNVTITLTRNTESLNLKGHWPEVIPVVQNLITIFYNKDEATTSKADAPIKEDERELPPIITVPDQDTRKVDDLESEIFKEIEEHAKNDDTKVSNVTKRKAGRPKKTPSTSSEQSEKAAKRPRRSKKNELDKAETQIEENKMADEISKDTKSTDLTRSSLDPVIDTIEEKPTVEETIASAKPKRQAQKKMVKENTDNEPVKIKVATPKTKAQDKVVVKERISKEFVKAPIVPRVTRSRKSGNETDASTRTVSTRLSNKPVPSEDQIRYMFPPEPTTRKSTKVSPNKTKSSENPHETLQGDLRTSVDSTQGYQDSDPSPAKVNATKRKRKTSITVRKGKYVPRRKSFPTLTVHDMSLDSSNSSYFVPKKSKSQSTLDSAIYKTESYEILMANRKHSIKKLDVIDETSKSDDSGHFHAVSKESINNSHIVVELGSSSNVSLPLSPELSLVENLTISREMIQSDNHPTINEMQANNSVVTKIYNQYLISDIDVSIPLMQQDCELIKARGPAKSKIKKQKSPIKVSELLSRVSVNMSLNNTLSDSLDRKLRDLLLESAQKITDFNKENLMDVDESNVAPKKTRGKKRCSTPRKRASKKQTKPAIGPVIDEHMESCSHGGRNSCPPVITFIPVDENANSSADVQLKAKPNPKPREKKDIIKVKIQRPKNTKVAKVSETPVADTSHLSVYTDSGINETASISEVFLQGSDSVELIHNHSETCLQANECIGNSIEFVENSTSDSIISVNSTASLEKELLKVMEDVEILSGRFHSQNAQDLSGEKSSEEVFGTPTETVYHSPLVSNCSLITDDLSVETPVPSTKWYLFSEDDTNNTNMRPELMTSNARVSNFSANLQQLFPITCAVPDLSTISEISKENEGSRKDFDTDSDTRSNYQN